MRIWNLKAGDPLSLTLASDARMGPTDYTNDHIWELTLGGGAPPALAIQTTFGLRAKAFRLFPSFQENDTILTDPLAFIRPPNIHQIFPNFIELSFSPFPDIDVMADYYVPQSHVVAGRLKIINNGKTPRKVRLEWIAQLTPTEGQRMVSEEIQGVTVLIGQTDGLSPVVFLSGGAKAGAIAFPSLVLHLELPASETQQFTWAEAALADSEASFALANNFASQKWEAVGSYLEMLNAGNIDIYTGDPDWDITFMLTQKQALSLLVGPSQNLPSISFVQTRQPDQGFSLRGDGSDYNHLWNGQTPLETYYLARLILQLVPQLAQGFLRNFLAAQSEDGLIDWKPGLAGQRSRLAATPILCSLAWQIYEHTLDKSFLEEIFPGLLRFLQSWFTSPHDRDGDGIPEWDHSMQSGTEDHPTYSPWHAWSLGINISTAESPSLCAFLYRECQALMRMANLLNDQESVPSLQSYSDRLKTAVETSWDTQASCYFDWDRDTHISSVGQWLGQRNGEGEILVQRDFEQPVRLQFLVHTRRSSNPRPHIFVHGKSASGNPRVEHITEDQFRWHIGSGVLHLGKLTGEMVYSYLEKIEIQGLDSQDEVTTYTAGHKNLNHSLLTPLWAGIPDEEHTRQLVENTLTNPERFWHVAGVPAFTQPPENPDAAVCGCIHLPWNDLIGEGLVSAGYRRQAAELVTRLMTTIIQTLKRESAFRRYYHADTGQGLGERNALNGLAPLGLFLQTLGVHLISPHRVALEGHNPFPWPVTVKYRGLTILRQKEKTVVIFPDGQTVVVSDPAPHIVALELTEN